MANAQKKNSAAGSIKDAVRETINQEKEIQEEKKEVEEEEEDELCPTLFEMLDESEEDADVEEQRLAYDKYKEVAKEIDIQLKLISDLEDEMWCIEMKRCLTPDDRKEIQRLRDRLFDESYRLESMTYKSDQLISGDYGICLCCYDLALPEPPEDDFVPTKSKPKRTKTADEICSCGCLDTDSDSCNSSTDDDSDLDSDPDTSYSDTYSEECLKIKIKALESTLITKYLAWQVSCWEQPNLDI